MFQPAYTMLGHNWLDERGAEGIGYVRAVGTLFPRQLLSIMPDMERLVQESFQAFSNAHLAATGKSLQSPCKSTLVNLAGNKQLPAYELNKKMLCKLNGFCFFGDELGKFIILMGCTNAELYKQTMKFSWKRSSSIMRSSSGLLRC